MINEYMAKFANELDLPLEIAQDMGGKYRFPMDDEIMIELVDIPPGFSLYAVIAKIPEGNLEIFFERAMHGNLLGQGTSGAVLGLTEDGKKLTLSLDIDYPIPYNEFKGIIEEFLNTADYWRDETISVRKTK